MLIEERLAKIQKIVNEQKSISMEALAEQVSVSKDTIRRDLIRLEKEGHLKRTHGGAISVQSEATIYDYAQRIMKHPEKKQAIAQKVWANIPKQASIFSRDNELSQSCATSSANGSDKNYSITWATA